MTNCEPINCPIPESLRTGRRDTKLLGRWQSGVETLSGYALQAVLSSRLPFQTHLLCSTP